jgi:hypothetical protein
MTVVGSLGMLDRRDLNRRNEIKMKKNSNKI